MSITPQEALQRTIEHREIFHDEMLHLMRMIMSGELSPVMTASIITGLRVKKETIGEITAAAQVMREFSTKVHVPDSTHLVDIVGTGGDGANTFNISTCSMFVAAAAGAKVSKHGGRGVSSKSGSADVMEALGIHINLKPEQIAQCIAEVGIGFMFAPNHHPAMKNVAPVRKELGVRTIFNILGPLTNPAGAPNILMGVFHPDLVGIQVRALQRLGDGALERHRARAQRGAGDGEALAQHQAGIETTLDTALHGNDDDAPVLGQTFDLAPDVVAGHHVEHHIHALATGDALHLLHEVLVAVVDRMVGAQLEAGSALVGTAAGGNHDGAGRLGQLDRRHADTAGAALHEQGLTRLQTAAVEHVAPDGEEGLGQRSRFDVAEALGHGQALRHRRDAVFGVAATGHQRADTF